MELAFGTRRLRTLCENPSEDSQPFSVDVAEALRSRLADLRAVNYLDELPVGRPTVTQSATPELRFPLVDGWNLIGTPNHSILPLDSEGALDLSRVRRILITGVAP